MNRTIQTVITVAAIALASTACVTAVRPMDRGIAYYNNGQYLAAIDEFTAAMGQSPNAAAYNNRAIARVRIADVNGAIEDYTRAIALTPYDAALYFNRGDAFVVAGQYARAVADFNRAVEISPTFARAWFNRGTAYALLGQAAAAARDWRHAIEVEIDPWAKSAMQRSIGLAPAYAFVPDGQPTIEGTVPPPPAGTATGATVPDASQPSASAGTVGLTSRATVIDARGLAARAISRELDGDHRGALADLHAALAIETDPVRRNSIANLLRLLDTPR